MQQATKRFQLTFGVLSVGYILLGLLQLFVPYSSTQIICTILGIAAIAVGILRIAMFFLRKEARTGFQNDLAVGAVLLMGGVYMIVNGTAIWSWLPIIIGFAIVFDSVIKMQYAFNLKQIPFKYWWIVLIMGLVSTVLAVLLVLDGFSKEGPFRIQYWAVVMIVDGVFNLATMVLLTLTARKVAKAAKQEGRQEKKLRRGKAEKVAALAEAELAGEQELPAASAEDVARLLNDAEKDQSWNDEL